MGTTQEIWKDVPDFEGVYQISNLGRLKSFKDFEDGRILSSTNKTGNYFSVVLTYRNKRRSARIHRLVAEAFIPNPNNYPHVHHRDGNKQKNFVENLEWLSAKDHSKISVEQDIERILGMVIYNSYIRPKEVLQCTLDGKVIKKFVNAKEAGRFTGVCRRNILQVANQTEYKPGKTRKQAGGYIWRFV